MFYATFSTIGEDCRAATGSTMSVLSGAAAEGVDPIRPGAASQLMLRGNEIWQAPRAGFVRLKAQAPVWVQIGDAPEASEGRDWFLDAGERETLAVCTGARIAVKAAPPADAPRAHRKKWFGR